MIHDDLWAKMDAFQAGIVSGAVQIVGKGERLSKLLDAMRKDPAFFYCDSKSVDSELMGTAVEFFDGGLLNLPFPEVVLVWDRNLPILAFEKDGSIVLNFFKPRGPLLVPHCALIARRGDVMYEIFVYNAKAGEKLDEEFSDWLCHIADHFFVFLLMLSMPQYYEREEVKDFPSKLQEARVNRGKAPLKNYTVIKLKKEYQEKLDRGGRGIKPHWRRGHLRTLISGKVVGVRPHPVGWSGEPEELSKNVYIVERE